MQTGQHTPLRIAVIGGGAAGFFAAITAAESNPAAQIDLYELSQKTLAKVKISGGGRCNVTHQCFDPAKLAQHYPRGGRELRGAFHRWQPRDTIEWFASRGVTLKAEADGRMFPTTDDSQTIIDCFHQAARESGINLHLGIGLQVLKKDADGTFTLKYTDGNEAHANTVCIAVGSLKSSQLSAALERLGHTLEVPVPSLFAFNVNDPRLKELAGVSVPNVSVRLRETKARSQMGPVLITHRGLSGPGILRLSAWEARTLHANNYEFEISLNWLGAASPNALAEDFSKMRKGSGKALVRNRNPYAVLPRRLWERLVGAAGIADETIWAQLPKAQERELISQITDGRFAVTGKTTNKEEFVTCGGVRLKEVNFKTMESRLVPGLYFAGECLDIDGITGGFNFQAAWTTAHSAGVSMAEE